MGRHKLLLDVAGRTVISRVVAAFAEAGVLPIHVVVREDDLPLREELRSTVATLHTVPHTTRDMRTSVELLLARVTLLSEPGDFDAWFLAPADHPVLRPEVIRELLAAATTHPGAIIIPTYNGRRGHPTLFPWSLATAVAGIREDRGLNWLIESGSSPVVELPTEDPGILCDLDTPADYERLRARFNS